MVTQYIEQINNINESGMQNKYNNKSRLRNSLINNKNNLIEEANNIQSNRLRSHKLSVP